MMEYHDPEQRARILGSGKRGEWLRVDDLIKNVAGVRAGMTCVDLGCGAGAVALPLSLEVGPEGKVYAVDINPELLARINDKQPPSTLVTVLNDGAATGLASSIADICFMVLILHEVPAEGMLQEAYRLLKPGGRIVVLEWLMEMARDHPPRNERISREQMELFAADSGFSSVEYAVWTEEHYVLTATK